MMLPLLNSLFFVAYCTAEMNSATTKDFNLNLTIGNYTEYTVTSCKMRCVRHSNCASIALKELPNTGKRPFICYLLQKDTDAKEKGRIRKEVEFEKMIVIEEPLASNTQPPQIPLKPVYTIKSSWLLKKDEKLFTLKRLYKTYNLTFELHVNEKQTVSGTNIIRLTIGGSNGNYGDRTPAIFLGSNHKLYVYSAVNSNPDFLANPDFILETKRWYKISVSQSRITNSLLFYFRIEIDGKKMFLIKNSDAREFENVFLYAADSFNPPTNAHIRNLALYTYLDKRKTCV